MDHTLLSGITQEEFEKNVEAAIQTLPSSCSQSLPLPSSSSSSSSSSPSVNPNLSTVNCLPANPIPIPSPAPSLCQSLHAGEEPATLLALPSIDAHRIFSEALDGAEEAIVLQFTPPQTPTMTLLESSAQDPSVPQAPYKPWVRRNSPSPSPSAQTLALPQNSYSTSRMGTAGLDIPGLQAKIDAAHMHAADAAHMCAADAARRMLIQIFPTVDQEVIEWVRPESPHMGALEHYVASFHIPLMSSCPPPFDLPIAVLAYKKAARKTPSFLFLLFLHSLPPSSPPQVHTGTRLRRGEARGSRSQKVLPWSKAERGQFWDDYFSPIEIPTIT
ncbi:hypothetical protein EDB89DRAFT_2156513 [Lactarius sanguifluus]|nr:hypothetical protein EDB89DRAFT_2156513 [Lactarius sanguifluus]